MGALAPYRYLSIWQEIRGYVSTGFNSRIKNMWDKTDSGFYDYADNDWTHSAGPDMYKRLDVNALGILTLLEYWLQTGMNQSSEHLTNATILYSLLNQYLWNSTYNAYEFLARQDWGSNVPSPETNRRIDLEANALMMRACLKLFSVTGNITYYNRAIDLYNFFENYLFNDTLGAYMASIGYVNNTQIDLGSNLKLVEAYIDAFKISENTQLTSWYNVSYSGSGPDFTIDEDTINLTSSYDFVLTDKYYDPASSTFKDYTIRYNLTDANITYIFRYPNGTIFDTKNDYIESNITVGNIAEITNITCYGDVNGSLNGTYFLINSPDYDFYIWFDLNDTGLPDPGLV